MYVRQCSSFLCQLLGIFIYVFLMPLLADFFCIFDCYALIFVVNFDDGRLCLARRSHGIYIYIILHACFLCFGCYSDSVNNFAATNCMFIRDAYFFCPWVFFVRSLIYLSHGAEFLILRNSLVCLWEKILLLCIQGWLYLL